ncbi:MAG: insulinase family protein, partial [Thermoanaerobaculia bacterium]|nr:insulinase family protein [Thermoanaerobaculia bacterium]
SMEDLNAATLEDVHEWFETYYGAANAVVAVAGDVEPEDVKRRVEEYFGDIPSGPPLVKPEVNVARRTQESRHVIQDRVPQARVYKAWNVAAYGSPDVEYLDLASDVLTDGKSSRLYKRLVYDEQIATDVSSFNYSRELGGLFIVWATVQPGGDLAAVEEALEEEMVRFLQEGPTEAEVDRARSSQRGSFLRGIERVGGFGGKSDVLAASQVYLGSPDAHEESQARILTATTEDVHSTAKQWLSEGAFTLEVHPFPEYTTTESVVDRSEGIPEVTEFPEGELPDRQETTLDNGMKVIVAERHAVPVASMTLLLNAGYAADQFGTLGTADLALSMLDEGTETRNALEISDTLDRLGATLWASSDLDTSQVSMTLLTENLGESLDLFSDVVLNPAFPAQELERLRKQQIAAIQREKTRPVTMALRVLPELLYGEDHAYSMPLTGSGTEESVAGIGVEDLAEFHSTWFRPNNAVLIAVGDVTMEDLLPRIERRFAGWETGEIPEKNLGEVSHREESVVYLIDRPDSEQSIILAGHVAPPRSDPDDLAIDAVHSILGGSFTARINMNLREDKHWSYGARTRLMDTAAQRPFYVYAPVQSDKTKESMAEIQKELKGIRPEGGEPPTAEELEKIKDKKILTLPGRWETNRAVLTDIVEMERFELPADYWETFAGEVRALTLVNVSEQAEAVVKPDRLVWVVVGDRSEIEEGIRELDLGEIRYLDADGNPVEAGGAS